MKDALFEVDLEFLFWEERDDTRGHEVDKALRIVNLIL